MGPVGSGKEMPGPLTLTGPDTHWVVTTRLPDLPSRWRSGSTRPGSGETGSCTRDQLEPPSRLTQRLRESPESKSSQARPPAVSPRPAT